MNRALRIDWRRFGGRTPLVTFAVAVALSLLAGQLVFGERARGEDDGVAHTSDPVALDDGHTPSGVAYSLNLQNSTGGLCFELKFPATNDGSGGCGSPAPDTEHAGMSYHVLYDSNETVVYGPTSLQAARVHIWLRGATSPVSIPVVEVSARIRAVLGISTPLNYYVVSLRPAARVERVKATNVLGQTIFDKTFEAADGPLELPAGDTEP